MAANNDDYDWDAVEAQAIREHLADGLLLREHGPDHAHALGRDSRALVPAGEPVAPQPVLAPPPSEFDRDLAREICDRLAAGQSLSMVCKAPDMPPRVTVVRWADQEPAFRAALDRALRESADALIEQTVEIADGWRITEQSRMPTPHENYLRDKMRLENRRWIAARLAPDKWGDAAAPGDPEVAARIAAAYRQIKG
jgi:hypothetical protein